MALVGFGDAGYLKACQLDWIERVWEPFFGDTAERSSTLKYQTFCRSQMQRLVRSATSSMLSQGSSVGTVHMPALNTTQFDWVLSRLPGRPQPVPPIIKSDASSRFES